MFTTGYTDTVTIKRQTIGSDSSTENRNVTFPTIFTGYGELYLQDDKESYLTSGVTIKTIQKLFLVTTVIIKEKDLAIVNGLNYNITAVNHRRGFSAFHLELVLEKVGQ